jgi:hypothetical protein
VRHFWWHDHVRDDWLAVATDEAGGITSAWVQIDPVGNWWVPVDDLDVVRLVRDRGEIHVNAGYTDELESSVEPVQ